MGTTFADMASAVDVLGQQAGIDFVDEKIMIDGIYEATVYLDNREINNLDQLRRLTASKIDNIIIIISPNAEYGNDIRAVVRISLLRIIANRLESESQMKMDLSDTPSLNFDQHLLWSSERIAVEASLSFKDADYKRTCTAFIQQYEPLLQSGQLLLKKRTTLDYVQNVKQRIVDATIGLSWKLAEDHKLSVGYELTSKPRTNNQYMTNDRLTRLYEAEVLGVIDPSIPPIYSSNQKVKLTNPKTRHEWNIAYSGEMGTSWTLVGNVNIAYEEPVMASIIKQEGIIISDIASSRYNFTEESRIIATHNTKNLNISFGFSDTYNWQNQKYDNACKDGDLVHAHFHHHTIGLFSNLERKWNKWSISAGLRYENTKANYRAQDDDEKLAELRQSGIYELVAKKNYHRLHPNATITYNLGKSEISLSYSQYVKPAYDASVIVERKETELFEGVVLESEWIHSTTLSLKHRKWLQASIAHSITRNPVFYTINDYVQYNGDDYHAFDATVIVSHPISIWQPTLNFSLHKQWNNMKTANGVNKLSSPLLNIEWKNIVNIPHKWTLYLNSSFRSKGAIRNQRMYTTNFTMDASIQKTLLKNRLLFTLSATNIFLTDCNDFSLYARAEKGTSDGFKIHLPRIVSFSAIYRFSK